jgi:hypothetical protein
MAESPARSNEDETTNRVYVILGTSHDIQWAGGVPSPSVRKDIDGLKSTIRGLIAKYKIKLIAEETLGPNSPPTVAREIADDEKICYREIDMSRDELEAAGIRGETDRRYQSSLSTGRNTEIRLRHADDIRENFWLDKIEGTRATPVLVVCGWAHTGFLAMKVSARHCVVAGDIYFPPCLREGKIECRP